MNKFSPRFKNLFFQSKNYSNVFLGLCILFILIFSIVIRLYPDYAHPQAEARLEAKAIIQSQISKKMKDSLLQKNPNLSEIQASQLAQKKMLQQLDDANPDFRRTQKQMRKILVAKKRGGDGLPLLGADPYYYLGLTQKYLSTGRLWDKRNGRDYFNPMMLAPTGSYYPIDLHPLVGAAIHKIFTSFNNNLSLEKTTRWAPVVLSIITVFLILYLGIRVYHVSTGALLVGALHLTFAPIYLKRSLIGWYDTDPYNVLFPLLITSLLGCIATQSNIKIKTRYLLGVSAGISMLLYSVFWRGWLLACSFLFFIAILCAILQSIFNKRHLRSSCLSLLIAFAIPILGSLTLWGPDSLKQEFASFRIFTGMLQQSSFPIWPDIFITVGELRAAGWNKALILSGGLISAALTFSILILQLIKSILRKKAPDVQILYFLLICSGVVIFSVSVERFALLAVGPLSLGFMLASHHLPTHISAIMRRIFTPEGQRRLVPLSSLFACALLLLSLSETAFHAYKQIYKFRPIYNTSWDRMMNKIRLETPVDAIITTWWSPGHFITSKAQRKVSIDGATQNETRAYWIARLFIETSEPSAIGILRMLNGSGVSLQNSMLDSDLEISASVNLINKIIPLPKFMVHKVLNRQFNGSLAADLTDLAYPEKTLPPTYLFIYKHMMDQIQALEYVGFWDFKKSELFNEVIQQHPDKIPANALKKGSKEYVKVLWSMTKPPTPTPLEGIISRIDAPTTYYSNGVSIGIGLNTIRVSSPTFGEGKPSSIYYVQNNKLIKSKIDNANTNAAVLFLGKNLTEKTLNTASKTVLIHPRLADSIAVRLYWLEGADLKFIKPVSFEDDITKNSRFVLYQVNWDNYFSYMEELERKFLAKK